MSFPSHLMAKAGSIRVVSMRVIETGTYNEQYNRPFMTDMDHQTQSRVIDKANQAMEQGLMITPMLMAEANFGKPIVTPSTNVQGNVDIPNGWKERRFRFILVLDVFYSVGSVNRFYYTGYSSHMDFSHGLHLDPNMNFFVNSVIRTSMTKHTTPTQGLVQTERNVTNRHMIADNNWGGVLSPNQKWMMRPEDVYMQMATTDIVSGNDLFIDTRNMSQGHAAMSNMSNALAHNYSSTILNSYARAARATATYGTDENFLTDAMKSLQVFNTHDDNPLAAFVSNVRGSALIQNNFTLAELVQLDNTFNDDRIDFTPLTAEDYGQVHQEGQTRPWAGVDGHTMAAVKISQAMPALMAVTMLQNVHIVSTNQTVGGLPETKVMGVGFNTTNLPQRNQALVDRFENEVIMDISYANRIGYYIEIKADALGETRIKVSLDNYPMDEFVSPSFADNLLSPVVTTSQQNFQLLASDFNVLISDLSPKGVDAVNASIDPHLL